MSGSADLRIAFIGLGVMGAPMARNLAAAGYRPVLCDGNPKVSGSFEAEGFKVFETASEAARDADVVLLMLPNSAIVREAAINAASCAAKGALFIDMSTGSVSGLLALGAELKEKGFRLMDAPMGRSRNEAVTGELLAMTGGSPQDMEQARPLLATMASDIFHVGELGQGLKLKLVNNYMSMINHVLAAEVLAIAEKVGLDRNLTHQVLCETAAGRGQLATNFPRKVLRGDVTPDFPIDMGIKDLNMAIELCEMAKANAGFGTLARSVFVAAQNEGFGQYDCTGILHYLTGQTAQDPLKLSGSASAQTDGA